MPSIELNIENRNFGEVKSGGNVDNLLDPTLDDEGTSFF